MKSVTSKTCLKFVDNNRDYEFEKRAWNKLLGKKE